MERELSNENKNCLQRGEIAYQYLDNGINIELYDGKGKRKAAVFFKKDEIYQRENVRWGWQSK